MRILFAIFLLFFAPHANSYVANKICSNLFFGKSNAREILITRLRQKEREFRASSKNHSQFLDKSSSIEEIASFVASRLEQQQAVKFLPEVEVLLSQVKLETYDESNPKWIRVQSKWPFLKPQTSSHSINGIKYQNTLLRNRMTMLFGNRAKDARVIWSTKKLTSEREIELTIERFIDIYSELRYEPIRALVALRFSEDSLIKRNLEAIYNKISLKIIALSRPSEKTQVVANTESRITNRLLGFLKSLIPGHYSLVRIARPTPTDYKVYSEHGPKGLYNKIKAEYGFSLAIKYWFVQAGNINTALIGLFAITTAPQLVYAYQLNRTESMANFNSETTFKVALEIAKNSNKSSHDIINDLNIIISSSDLTNNEVQYLKTLREDLSNLEAPM